MPRINKPQRDSRRDQTWAIIILGGKLTQAGRRIRLCVNGFDRWLAALLLSLIDELHIPFLDVTAIQQHDPAQIACGMGTNNVAFETAFDEVRNIARMIGVSM